ncbi:MAG: transposase, partial [Lachnospiraceae bacterium]|nr:transposase [Lachnospiraceae bacterium]
MNNIYEGYTALEYEVKYLRKLVIEYQSGERYKKIQNDYHKVIEGYKREIRKLREELAESHARTVSVRNLWFETCDNDYEKYQAELKKQDKTIGKLQDKIWKIIRKNDDEIQKITENYKEKLEEKDAVIKALTDEVARLNARLNRDSTNTSIPTSKTPIDKNKHIPNSRRSTGKPKGGQIGHKKHILEAPAADEITEVVDKHLDDSYVCPCCRCEDLIYTGECEHKYEHDIRISVVKRDKQYHLYRCAHCGQLVRSEISPDNHAKTTYGPNVKAMALSLMNTTNAAINKTVTMLSGISNGEISPSEGYIAKLQRRSAQRLKPFMNDLLKMLITRPIVYWDDTVIMINKHRGCLRFYGDEKTAYFVAHKDKSMDGVVEDGVLPALPEEATVMHDHCSISYNSNFVFKNIECNAHLQRDLQKNYDDTKHKELIDIKNLISNTIKDRNDLCAKGKPGFDEKYIERFDSKLSELLEKAGKIAEANESKYFGVNERRVINRIIKYRNNFFAWVKDFNLPTTNNLSESSIRIAKTKVKVSGQFNSVDTANNY